MTFTHWVLMFGAAFAAGAINSIAGGGTLISFPALVGIGLDPKIANATSTVALWPGLAGSLWGYRKELEAGRPYILRLGITSLLGGTLGTFLLIKTPSVLFSHLVPYLILFATILFTLQEQVSRWFKLRPVEGQSPSRGWWIAAIVLQFCSAIYGAYFGAGNGILILAVLGLIGLSDIHIANGLKIVLAIFLNSVAVLGFSISHLVAWTPAFIMIAGAICGGYAGASGARKLRPEFVRKSVIAIGLIISAMMLWRVRNSS